MSKNAIRIVSGVFTVMAIMAIKAGAESAYFQTVTNLNPVGPATGFCIK